MPQPLPPLPGADRPAQGAGFTRPPASAPASPRPGRRRLAAWPLTHGLWLLGAGAVLLAAALAVALVLLLPAWPMAAAAAGAVAGTLVLGAPVAWLLLRLAREAERQTHAPAGLDAETGAASREMLVDLAQREFARARRYGTGAAVLLVEVDRFSRLGESRGRDAGEAVLRELARQVAPTLRGADVLARDGGTRLLVFLVQADATGALDVAERIRERAEQLEVPWHPQRLRFTVSVGVAHLRPAHPGVQALFDDAEDAMQAARDAGGNCVRAAPVERRLAARGTVPGLDPRTRTGG